MSLVDWLLTPSGLTPHGFCLSWAPGLIALHAGSDAVVGVSYFSIPLALVWFVRQRRDLSYRWVFYAFVAFILACGTTHFFSVLTLWQPAYGAEGLVKLATALLSVVTAVILWPLVPRLVALPSPAQLGRLNAELSSRIGEQERTTLLLRESDARVRAANIELEQRVAERTAALQALNAELTKALAERASAQRAQALSEAEFRASFEGATVGHALTEPASRRLLRVNRAFARMFGREPEEMVGRTAAELTWPEDRVSDEAAYARLLDGEAGTHVREKRYIRRDGTPFWARVSATLARLPDSSHPVLTVAVIEDIDARYRAEADLRATNAALTETLAERDRALHALAISEAQFRAGFDAAAVGIVLTEPRSIRVVLVNHAFARMLDYTPDELIGRDGPKVLWPEDRTSILEARARMLAGEIPSYVREARCMRRDGSPLWTRISSSSARDPLTSEAALTVTVVEDIDARYRAEAELRALNATLTETLAERDHALQALARSEAQFRTSFDAAAVGMALAEPESRRIIRVNPALATMLGYEPEELVGRDGAVLVLPEDLPVNLDAYARLLSGESPTFVREARCARRDGTPLWTRISVSLVRNPQTGQPVLNVSMFENIDARYKAEADLRSAKRDLERLVDERTAALRQRDLLLREVYHRVKNNLQIVDGLLVMQGRQLEDMEAKQALQSLRSRIYALGLVHQQLMGSTDLRTFDVVPFLQELSRNILEGGAAGNVSLSIDACPLQVGLDFAVPLGLLVTELVTNSLKHAFPDRAGNVSVMLQPGIDGDVVLVVSDDGQGRTGVGAAGQPKTGLGLRIIRGLVAQLNGRMDVTHEVGTRTEIRTAMPAQPETAPPQTPQPQMIQA